MFFLFINGLDYEIPCQDIIYFLDTKAYRNWEYIYIYIPILEITKSWIWIVNHYLYKRKM